MTDSFPDFLNSINADNDSILIGMRLFIAATCNDIDESEAHEKLSAASDKQQLDTVVANLATDEYALVDVALMALSSAWETPSKREDIRSALAHAKEKFVVVEAALLTIICLYGMYLSVTEGRTKRVHKITHHPDGTYSEELTEEWANPGSPLSAVAALFGKPSKPAEATSEPNTPNIGPTKEEGSKCG